MGVIFQKINNVSIPESINLQNQPKRIENMNYINIEQCQNQYQSSFQNKISDQSSSDENSLISNDTIDLNVDSKSTDSSNDSWMINSPEKIKKDTPT